jgi:transposase-like protein
MPRHQRRDTIFRYRRYEDDLIVLCVRRYVTYRLSLRDLAAIMAERGLEVHASTIWRWVQHFETYVLIRGQWCYLYRAVDKLGRTVDFHLTKTRDIAAAKAFFRKARCTVGSRGPRTVTLDGHRPTHRALRMLRREHSAWRRVHVRTNRYLNNLIEQDHRAVKRRCAAMHGLKSFTASTITIARIELAHRIRKHQFRLGHAHGRRRHSLMTAWERALFGV